MRHCYGLRVFTRDGEGGHALGVVTDVSGLSERSMQQVATDSSETVFIDWRDGGVPHVRMFTPDGELPFAGRPLVGAGWVMNVLGPSAVPLLRCAAGDVPVRLAGNTVVIEVPPADRRVGGAELPPTLRDWVDPVDVWIAAVPEDHLIVHVANPGHVTAVDPAPTGRVMLWAWDDGLVKARLFGPDLGVPEALATETAAVALASVLHASGRAGGATTISQGDEVGCPSAIVVQWQGSRLLLGGAVIKDETRELEI